MVDERKFEKRLKDRLRELEERLKEIEDNLEEPSDPDVEERATEREGDEVLEELGHAGLVEISMIRSALARIEDGSFGVCTKCGEPISEERLEVLPHTPNCRRCA